MTLQVALVPKTLKQESTMASFKEEGLSLLTPWPPPAARNIKLFVLNKNGRVVLLLG